MAKKKVGTKTWVANVIFTTDAVDNKTACEVLQKFVGDKAVVHSACEVKAAWVCTSNAKRRAFMIE